MNFWQPASFDLSDRLNRKIWKRSPYLQLAFQPPPVLQDQGRTGAQQAMNEQGIVPTIDSGTVLPWVPDIVGLEWRERDALVVIGAAYAGFIGEYSKGGRRFRFRLQDYNPKAGMASFQQAFLDKAVPDHRAYYDGVQALLRAAHHQTPARLCLLDLCRASLVTRLGVGPSREDESDERVFPRAGVALNHYVEGKTARSWLWQRITTTGAARIVAFGRIAEHGILRLFANASTLHDTHIDRCGVPWARMDYVDGSWTEKGVYADPQSGTAHWSREWWTVTGKVGVRRRRWCVLTVPHPARTPSASYGALEPLLSLMLQ